MKKVFALAFVIYFSAYAQSTSVLIEACNSIQEPAKRLECLKAAIDASVGKKSNSAAAIDPLKRAFSDMQASLEVGISYNNYQVAVLDLAKSLAAYKIDAGEEGSVNLPLFDAALEAYRDAGIFWERSISFYARRGNDLAYGGGLPVSLSGLDWIVGKYGLPTVKSDIWGLERGLPVQSTRIEIWRIAKAKADQGFSGPSKQSLEAISAQLFLSYSPYTLDDKMPERTTSEKIAKGSACSSNPFLSPVTDLPTKKEFMVKCTDGTTLKIVCEAGLCKGTLSN